MEISRRDFVKVTSLAAVGLSLGFSVNNRFDSIIKNGFIIDGSGKKMFKGDIGISGNKIAAIGDLSSSSADLIIDANNMYVSPGFIDIHTHTDIELLVNGGGESKIMQGVTSEISGNCGSSPFPYLPEDAKSNFEHLKSKYDLDVYWETMDEFYNLLKDKISINYASFTGHGDLRAFVMGRNDVPPTDEQLKQLKKVLAENMEMGSFGLSTGLEYAPGSYANTQELIELSKIVAKYGGLYNTHMRNEDDTLLEAIDEAIEICKQAEVNLEIAHLKTCNPANWFKVDKVIEKIEQAHISGLPVNADRYPYIAYGTGLSTFLPLWSRQGTNKEIIERLNDQSLLPKIKDYAQSRGNRIGGWKNVVISNVNKTNNKIYEGKNIVECAENNGLEPLDFIIKLLLDENLSVGMVGFAMNEDNLRKILKHNLVMIGSDGNATSPLGKLGEGKPHPRYYGTFARVLGKYCREEKLFDWETAINKMTYMPAKKINLKNRGLLENNYFADIVVFNPNTIIDKATFVDPKQFASGIEYVFVNGKLSVNKGVHTKVTNGFILRKI
ncbi:MAG TPA: D-aminoacylase [Melioribacteraceae bacterium]|nr:D-aminoacylase [Melioribacteraceae bacterium]